MYEVQAKFLHEVFEDTTQLAENITIQGVEDGLLENRYGVFTGLAIRPEQTITQYRDQTACLWKSYQFASMEKGLIDSLKCILGDIAIDDEFLDGRGSGTIYRDPDLDIVGTLDFEPPAFGHEILFDAVFDRDGVAASFCHAALDKQVGFG